MVILFSHSAILTISLPRSLAKSPNIDRYDYFLYLYQLKGILLLSRSRIESESRFSASKYTRDTYIGEKRTAFNTRSSLTHSTGECDDPESQLVCVPGEETKRTERRVQSASCNRAITCLPLFLSFSLSPSPAFSLFLLSYHVVSWNEYMQLRHARAHCKVRRAR